MSGHSQFDLLKQRRFLPYFTVQALGAFNDNVFRQAIIGLLGVMAAAGLLDETTRGTYTQLAPAVFILPYFLFSSIAGQFAERTEKSKLIRITTAMEIAIMSLAAVGFLLQNMVVLLVALFATGVQSTLFGPVKYSILPSVLKPEELTGGNGLVEMGTSIAVLLGMLFGGLIFTVAGPEHGPMAAAIAVILLAIAGNLLSRAIPAVPAPAPDLKIQWNPIPESIAILKLARKQLAVRNSILGVSWFWFTGTVLTGNLPVYAETHLGGTPTLYVFALAVFSIGVGVGSLLCEKLSARTVEIGLVPLGAIGMSACIVHLALAPAIAAKGLDVSGFISQPGAWRVVLDLAGIGLFSGFFVVPLFALIQSRSPREELSRVIAGMNIQNAVFIVAAALGGVALQQFLGWSIPQVFLALGIASILVAAWIFSIVPEFLMRFLSWLLVRGLYRLKLHGIEKNVPDEGAALLVCNHVSFMDALVLAASIPRPVRFVMYYKIFNIPVMRWIFKTAKAIPIAGARENPELMQRAFDEVDAVLAEGELVCIFPEGALTKDGNIAPFKSGVERILQRAAARGQVVQVVPMALRNMWGSMWSRRANAKKGSALDRMRVPRRLRAHVDVVAGEPVDGGIATAELLEAKVRELRGDAA
ncbi:MFS transporter [Thermomonas carbonis]|uniref:MFS transporter n=1 Tax=Thermomonas carbonis TaxID=1463158 RepID=A0A7G9SRX6_9GAMM|nr:MFS transporter [Thermomonas carbonis]QNN70601.1 MFS transporter [Thermomonas carbonis]GHC01049.1 MFS transporter [Thermomonas carbonis]